LQDLFPRIHKRARPFRIQQIISTDEEKLWKTAILAIPIGHSLWNAYPGRSKSNPITFPPDSDATCLRLI
jgi:hypothetical protein